MTKQFILNAALLFSIVMIGASNLYSQSKRDINNDWYFQKGEVENALSNFVNLNNWQKVSLPHTFNPSGSTKIYREKKAEVTYTGDACYRKNLFIEKALQGKRLFLHFDGAYLSTNVYVNGHKLGNHRGGFTAFCYEITKFLKYGSDNVIVVKVSSAQDDTITPLGGGYVKFGGVTRPVCLLIKNQMCISPLDYASTGVYCTQKKITAEKAEIEVKTILNATSLTKGKYKLECQVIDSNNKVVARDHISAKIKSAEQWSVSMPMSVDKPNLWNGLKNPALYTVRVSLYQNNKLIDKIDETTGFRTVSVDRNKGFFLNGKSYPLYGVAMHQYYPGVGSAMRKENFDSDMNLLLDLGVTGVRLAHYPHSQYRFDLLDKHGVIAMTELPLIKYFLGNKAFIKNCHQQVEEIVHQYYNHPSIAIWGLYNEIRYDEYKGFNCIEALKDINATFKQLDPSRLTCGTSWKSGKRNDIADISGWNRYQGWYWNAYPGGPDDFTWIDRIRKEFPNRILGITEYGAGGAINHFDENRKIAPYNQDQFHPVDFYNYSQELQWKEIKERPWLWGSFVWNLSEFLVPDYNQGRATFIHDKGLTAQGGKIKKDAYYFYKANWKKEPVFHLAYKQFNVRLSDNAEVTVYSNLDKVSLSVNGKDYGTLKNAEYVIYRWTGVPLQKGNNEIKVSSNKDGKQYQETALWHRVTNIHKDELLKEIVPCSSSWKVLFNDKKQELKSKRGSGIPGEEINTSFKHLFTTWNNLSTWKEVVLPLQTKTQTSEGNWLGKTTFLYKEFSIKEGELSNPYIYLKQTARLSKENAGRVSIAIDNRVILTIDEGCDAYRLIPIGERLGQLKAGQHKICVIANTPVKGGILDVGLINKKDSN